MNPDLKLELLRIIGTDLYHPFDVEALMKKRHGVDRRAFEDLWEWAKSKGYIPGVSWLHAELTRKGRLALSSGVVS